MQIHPKSPEHLKSQTVAFAHEQGAYESIELMHRLGEATTAFLSGQDVPVSIRKFTGGTVETTFTPDQYAEFLRSADSETRADINFLAENTEAYPLFEESVNGALDGATEADDHFLGRGLNGKAFSFQQGSKSFAVKVGGVHYNEVRALRRGEHIKGVSHLEAVDLERELSVMGLVPGDNLEKTGIPDFDKVPRTHIKALIDTAVQMYDAGLQIDPKISNFLYDTKQGFGVIDYNTQGRGGWSLAEQVLSLRHPLMSSADEVPKYGTPERKAWDIQAQTESVQRLDVFLDILENDYPGILQQAAEIQAKRNTNVYGAPSLVYKVDDLPEGQLFEDFRARIQRLGLEGATPVPRNNPTDDDIDIIG